MRLRLGLLQDPAAIERQVQRELAELNARRSRALSSSSSSVTTGSSSSSSSSTTSTKIPTVKTEAQSKLDDGRIKKEKERLEEKARKLPKVRPLSEAKAIESGANFISEAFLFCVAGGLIGLEYWRSKRKENSRRDDVKERLGELESENSELKAQIIRIERVLEGEGTRIGDTSEWLMLAKKNLGVDKKVEPKTSENPTTGEHKMNSPQQSLIPTIPAKNNTQSKESQKQP